MADGVRRRGLVWQAESVPRHGRGVVDEGAKGGTVVEEDLAVASVEGERHGGREMVEGGGVVAVA